MAHDDGLPRYAIVNGPSKYELMLAVFDQSLKRPRPVTFHVVPYDSTSAKSREITCQMTGVDLDVGVDERWFFRASDGSFRFLGYYCTVERTGHLTPVGA